jgi:hypothetical protein
MSNPTPLTNIQYFVKFIGDQHVALAKAHTDEEVEILLLNHYEATTEDFYDWVLQQTQPLNTVKTATQAYTYALN